VRKYVIMGPQGSGKGTQAKLMTSDLDIAHISVGDILRWNVSHYTKLGAQVRRLMSRGELVGDDLVQSLVASRMSRHDWNHGFVVDGFPRNLAQAEFFLESYDLDGVINLDMPDEQVKRRVLARRLCSQCGLDYNLIASRPRRKDRCDACGGKLVTREDDTPEALDARLKEYREKTQPVIDIFSRKEFVATIDATAGIDEVQADIRRQLDLSAIGQGDGSSSEDGSAEDDDPGSDD